MSTPESTTQSRTSASQTEISEENIHHEQPSVFNPFQKEMFMYLVEGFKVSSVSKLVTWEMFIHKEGVEVLCVCIQFSSVAQSCTTLRPHRLHHAGLPYPSPTPGACSDSCPLSW